MTTLAATVDPRAHQHQVVRTWDRLWTHQPSDAKDDELLARERKSKRWRLILERLRRHFGAVENLRTIELGSGRGDLSALLAQEGACVALLDSSERALFQARQRFGRLGLQAEFLKGDLFKTSELERYDIAISSGVIEHFTGHDRTRSLEAHRAVLGKKGLAIISVPNAHCFPYRLWKAWLELRGCWPYGFEKPYSRRELSRRAHQAGLGGIEVHGCGFQQAVNDQFLSLMMHRPRKDCADSVLDDRFGLSLILFGWNA